MDNSHGNCIGGAVLLCLCLHMLQLMEDIINKMMDYKMAWPFWEMVNKKDVSYQLFLLFKNRSEKTYLYSSFNKFFN